MKACFPVAHDRGLDTRVHPHFGSAPMFLVVDTETRETRPVVNGACEHAHGHCQPLAGLAQERVDAVVVGGIGPGALEQLRRAGIPVYRVPAGTVREAIDAIAQGALKPVPEQVGVGEGIGCAGHGHGHDHGHGPGHDAGRGLVRELGGPHRHRHHGE